MTHFAHSELIRIHHAELRRAAEHHRLAAAVHVTDRSRRPVVAQLLDLLTRPALRRPRPIPEAEPCPP